MPYPNNLFILIYIRSILVKGYFTQLLMKLICDFCNKKKIFRGKEIGFCTQIKSHKILINLKIRHAENYNDIKLVDLKEVQVEFIAGNMLLKELKN